MNIIEIDAAIRARIDEIKENGGDELDIIYTNYLPSAAEPYWWNQVTNFVTEVCNNDGGGADCRPGRLYELTDEAIIEAQYWLKDNEKKWRVMLDSTPVEDVSWSPGRMIQVEDNSGNFHDIPVAVSMYVGAAFME